jgi:hypothetical protein
MIYAIYVVGFRPGTEITAFGALMVVILGLWTFTLREEYRRMTARGYDVTLSDN